MFRWQPTTRREWYRLGLIAVVLIGVGVAALTVGVHEADAETDLSVNGLTVDGVNDTVSGNVSDVTLTTDLEYTHDVPDAENRLIQLRVGPSTDDLETITYINEHDPAADATGTVTLTESVLKHSNMSASDVDPATAETETTEFVVSVVLEVDRVDSDAVTHTVTDTVTVTLTDDAQLTVKIGGTGSVSVATE